MTKERLDDLFAALSADGWELLDPDARYLVESEIIAWNLEHLRRSLHLTLNILLFDGLGRRTDSLDDVSYAQVQGAPLRLYFAKRGSDEWPSAVRDFVRALREIDKAQS